MRSVLDDPPYRAKVVESSLLLSGDWTRWVGLFWALLKSATQVVGDAVSVSNQNATIPTTAILTIAQGGTYRVTWYLRITTADGVSSSAQVTLTWREGSQTCTKTFTAITGDTVTTVDGQVWPIHADSGTVVSYGIAYASNTPLKMRYRFDAVVEQIN